MLRAQRHSDQGKAAVLMLRIWFEAGHGDPQLRIRMIGRADLDQDAYDSKSASTIVEALDSIRDWMEGFASRSS